MRFLQNLKKTKISFFHSIKFNRIMGLMDKLTESIPCVISRRTSFMTMTLLLGSFFLVEIVVGYITNSMALIADAFHMLSDVASLIVGFFALKYSTIQAPRETYTYGYARAEVLGALVNAVFLVALCFSIFIEALKRLFILEEIENPLLVFIVGAIGLLVNIFGMFLFHQTGHGHTHGGLSHSHSHGGPDKGHGHSHGDRAKGHGHSHDNHNQRNSSHNDSSHEGIKFHSTPVNDSNRAQNTFSPSLNKVIEEGNLISTESKTVKSNVSGNLFALKVEDDQHQAEETYEVENNEDTHTTIDTECNGDEGKLKTEQGSTQNNSNTNQKENEGNIEEMQENDERDDDDENAAENDPLLPKDLTNESSVSIPILNDEGSKDVEKSLSPIDKSDKKKVQCFSDSTEEALREEENENEAEQRKRFPTKFRSAAALNIHAVYLHILGDALGSIIVMLSALIIIYAEGPWTLYVDPTMSIIMVAIILKTSIPLLIETSKILMNSVPHHIQVNDLKKRLVKNIPQIKNVHELHIWQLAGEKIIASAHVKLTSPSEYEEVATKIKDFFHNEGIHSTTIQIEYEKEDNIDRRGECMVVCSLDSACDDMMCCKPGEN